MPLKSDALLRLLICDLVGEEITRESMATLRDEIADLAERLEESDRSARGLPHREKYLRLVNGFLRRFLELHEKPRRRRRARARLRSEGRPPATRVTPVRAGARPPLSHTCPGGRRPNGRLRRPLIVLSDHVASRRARDRSALYAIARDGGRLCALRGYYASWAAPWTP